MSSATYSGRGGLVTKQTKGRRRRVVPIIDPLRGTLVRLTIGRPSESRLLSGPRSGVITTATLRDATHWDRLVTELGLTGLVRHGLRHTALNWRADAGVPLHVLQRVAGHQDPAVTSRYLHPDVQAMLDAGPRLGLVVPNWSAAAWLDRGRPWSRGAGTGVSDLRFVQMVICRADRI